MVSTLLKTNKHIQIRTHIIKWFSLLLLWKITLSKVTFSIQNMYNENTSALNIHWTLACKCIIYCYHAELIKQTTSKSIVWFLLFYPPHMPYSARSAGDVHMPIYLHLSSARFLLHTMIMMMQTISTIKIAPTTIAIIMMRCSLSSFPHQPISAVRKEWWSFVKYYITVNNIFNNSLVEREVVHAGTFPFQLQKF